MARVPSSDRLTSSVPGKRPVSVGRSASRQRVGTNGYRPRTRNEPPGGGVRRRKFAAGPAGSSGVDEGLGLADGGRRRLGSRAWGSGVPSETTRCRRPRGGAVRWSLVRPRGSRALLGSRRIILTTLAGRAAMWPAGNGSRRKCDKTTPFGLTAPSPLSYVGCALIGERPGTGSRQGTLAETPRSRTGRKVGSSGTLRSGPFLFPSTSLLLIAPHPVAHLIPTLTGSFDPLHGLSRIVDSLRAPPGAHGMRRQRCDRERWWPRWCWGRC